MNAIGAGGESDVKARVDQEAGLGVGETLDKLAAEGGEGSGGEGGLTEKEKVDLASG